MLNPRECEKTIIDYKMSMKFKLCMVHYNNVSTYPIKSTTQQAWIKSRVFTSPPTSNFPYCVLFIAIYLSIYVPMFRGYIHIVCVGIYILIV